MEAGWQRALQTLSDAEHATGLARIVAAFDSNVDHLVAMERMLHQYAVLGRPEIDNGKSARFINTDRRLGNSGAATFYMLMALGVMGSYIEGAHRPASTCTTLQPSKKTGRFATSHPVS